MELRQQIRRGGLAIAVAISFLSGPAMAQAGDRILLDRENAEFTALFFALSHGSQLSDEPHVNCRKRVALNVRRCRLNWEAKGKLSKARLEVAAFKVDSDLNRYRVRYRLEQIDKRCAAAAPTEDCTSVERGHESYSGG